MKRSLLYRLNYRPLLLVCFLTSFFGIASFAHAGALDWAGDWLADLIYNICIMIGGLFVGIGGLALDLSIQLLIIGMGDFFGGQYGTFGQGVIEMWKVIRDLLNIFFIFGFIYIGIRTILDADESSTRKALGYLIIAALFINFSLYITGAVIDFSNIAATQIYKVIISNTSESGAGPISIKVATAIDGQGIAGAFVNISNISSFFGGEKPELNAFQIIAFSIFMLIFFVFAGFIFLIAAIRVVIRFVALTLYMIFSPVMFLGWILPKFSKYSEDWRSGLISNSFYAPVFLFLIYIALFLMARLKSILFADTPADYTAVFKGGQVGSKEFLIFIFFGMMMAFIYASMRVGDTMSIAGAKATQKMVEGVRGNIQGTLYRNTAGRASRLGLGAYDRLDKAAADGHVGARITRSLIGGEPTRHAIERASNYGAGGQGLADVEKEEKARKARLRENAEKAHVKETAKKLKDTIKAGTTKGASDKARIDLEAALNDASTADLVKLADDKEGKELLKKVIGSLPEKKFETIMANNDLSPEYKNGLGDARATSVADILRTSGTLSTGVTQTEEEKLREGLKSATADQLNALNFEMLSKPENIIYTQSGQLDKLESKWGDEKMRLFKAKRNSEILKAFGTDPGLIIKSRKGDKEIAKLPTEIFRGTNRDTLLKELIAQKKLTGGLMQNIATDSGLNGTDKKEFGAAVRAQCINPATGLLDYAGAGAKDIEKFLDSAAGAAFGGSR